MKFLLLLSHVLLHQGHWAIYRHTYNCNTCTHVHTHNMDTNVHAHTHARAHTHTHTHTHTQSMAYYMLTTLSVVECLFILMILDLSGQSANFSLNSMVSKPSFSLTNYAQLGCSQCFTFKSSTTTKTRTGHFLAVIFDLILPL